NVAADSWRGRNFWRYVGAGGVLTRLSLGLSHGCCNRFRRCGGEHVASGRKQELTNFQAGDSALRTGGAVTCCSLRRVSKAKNKSKMINSSIRGSIVV